MEGDEDKVLDLAKKLTETKPLNSWGAQLDTLTREETGKVLPIEKHQVTTENVDKFKWNKNVEFYLK